MRIGRHRAAVLLSATLVFLTGSASAGPEAPAEAIARESGAGISLTDAKGLTLYTYDKDTEPGKSLCNGQCAQAWPPLLAAAGAKDTGNWTVITRDDGQPQWAYKGKPLYRFVRDTAPGAASGDGVQAIWHVAFDPIRTPVGMTLQKSAAGRLLADDKGLALYVSDADRDPAKSVCSGTCTQSWQPLMAPWIAGALGPFAPVKRADGTRQWAYQGKPLYRFAGEVKPGATSGEGEGWHPVILEPAAPAS
jgi:predicted lipoprotein with Yx(FWY)xxD motif